MPQTLVSSRELKPWLQWSRWVNIVKEIPKPQFTTLVKDQARSDEYKRFAIIFEIRRLT